MTWWVVLGIFGGLLLGLGLGAAWGLSKIDEAQSIASNTAIAVFAVTIELTYGAEFLEDLIEEANSVMDTEQDLIIEKVAQIRINQRVAELRRELKGKE